MKAVYLKELRSYFTTPLGYVFMAFMLVLFGIYFMLYGLIYQSSDYSYVLNAVTLLILFALPLLTMRMFSEEMKNCCLPRRLRCGRSCWENIWQR